MRDWHSIALAVGLALGTPSCDLDDDDDDVVVVRPPQNPGTLSARWTIEGRVDPDDCEAFDAEFLELVAFDQFGAITARTFAPCQAFTVSIVLDEGEYAAEVRLVDGAALGVSDEQRFEDLFVTEGDEVVISADFPEASFR